MFWVMIIAGIGLMISKANELFVVPDVCIYICFGMAAILLAISIIQHIWFKREYKKFTKRW